LYDPVAPQSYDTPVTWYWYTGGDWSWFVAKHDSDFVTPVVGLGWQTVDRYWDYYKVYDSAREAMFLHSNYEDDDDEVSFRDGWAAGRGGGLAKIDDSQASNNNGNILNYGDTVNPFFGGLTQANTWRATGRIAILKGDEGRQIVGSIDAWGVDDNGDQFVPPHTAEVTAGGRTYEYINPLDDSWDGDVSMFFRTG